MVDIRRLNSDLKGSRNFLATLLLGEASQVGGTKILSGLLVVLPGFKVHLAVLDTGVEVAGVLLKIALGLVGMLGHQEKNILGVGRTNDL